MRIFVHLKMVSVERVLEFSKLPLEAPLESEDKKKLPADWPQQGCIFVENANLKYSDDSPVILKDLSFNIKPKEKVVLILLPLIVFEFWFKSVRQNKRNKQSKSHIGIIKLLLSDTIKDDQILKETACVNVKKQQQYNNMGRKRRFHSIMRTDFKTRLS